MKFDINNKAMQKRLIKAYQEIFRKMYSRQRLQERHLTVEALEKARQRLLKDPKYRKYVQKVAKQLTSNAMLKQRHEWKEMFDKAKDRIKLNYTYKQSQIDIAEKITRNNIAMINSIPKSIITMSKDKWCKQLRRQVMTGDLPRSTFEKELNTHAIKNAKMIARTEAAKLQTNIIKERSKSIGSIAYKWRSSHDKRTRQSHKDMNDVIVFWRDKDEEKPRLDGYNFDAGQIFNCRCDAQPIFDMNDLNGKLKWEVWDYRTKRIITVDRQVVSRWLEEGQIF